MAQMAITSRPAALAAQLATLEAQQAAASLPDEWVAAQIDDTKQKLAQLAEQDKIWDTEHALRSHNYVGLVHAALLQLARQGKLGAQVDGAKAEMRRRGDEKKAKGQPIEVDDF